MPPKRRKFYRPKPERRYKKRFVLVVEGRETEPQYFAIFNDRNSTVHVKCLKKGDASAPPNVLKKMRDYLKKNHLEDSYEAWLVVDHDKRDDEKLLKLHEWSQEKENYRFALSNPNFEFWLLLHFDEGAGVSDKNECMERLKRYLPNYNKGIEPSKFTDEGIKDAIGRAKQRDNPPCRDWPRESGKTTVYKLVESLLSSE